ncbi:MAG: hypothetical protein HC892_16895 [Saprospiraceae bacterium]|nr:hypothetical protein [Saprospiraceae bacterium]
MTIHDNRTLREIQIEFQSYFPFLKIEFYDAQHTAGEGSPPCQQIFDLSRTIRDIKRARTAGEININDNLKVSTLEQSFYELYGLNVQVFRNSCGVWLQTTITDHWTLGEQNSKAKEFLHVRGI